MVSFLGHRVATVILKFQFRLLPSRIQHRALEGILESQRQLYNAALEERIGAYRKANKTLTYIDQTKGLTEWRRSDPVAVANSGMRAGGNLISDPCADQGRLDPG